MTELLTAYDVIIYYLSIYNIFKDIFFIGMNICICIVIFPLVHILNRNDIIFMFIIYIFTIGILFSVKINIDIFSIASKNDIEFIYENIDKVEYAECINKVVLYDGNILQFSSYDYAECVKKNKMNKLNNEIKDKINTIKL